MINFSEIKIEPGVPLPSKGSKSGAWRNLLSKMSVGDSCFIPGIYSAGVSGRISRICKVLKIKTTTRTEGTGVRIWRIE